MLKIITNEIKGNWSILILIQVVLDFVSFQLKKCGIYNSVNIIEVEM